MCKLPPKHLHFVSPQDPCSKTPPKKKQGVWFQLKNAQADHPSDGCTFVPGFCNCLESRWGGPQGCPPHLVEHFITPKNRRDWWFFWPPKVGGDFFLLREMGDSGLFQGNLGCSRWWYHAEGVFFFEWFTWKGHRSQEIRWTWTPWSYFKGSIRWTWGMFIFFCVANLSRIILFRTNMNDDSRSLRYCNTALDFHSRPLQVCFAVCLNVVIRNSKNHFDISLLNLWIAHSEQSQNWRHYIWDLIPVHLRHHRS